MVDQTVICSYLEYSSAINNNVLLITYNFNESSENFAEWNKPIPKGYVENDYIYITAKNDEIVEMENTSMVTRH